MESSMVMWDRPNFETTFENIVQSRTLGVYRFEDCLSIYLDTEYLKSKGIYDEVKAHEETHLQLTTSTTIGHLLMFLAISKLRLISGYKEVYEGLVSLSREAQEGAATLTEWYVAQQRRPAITEDQFLKTLGSMYVEAFSVFNHVAQIVLAPECYWMKPVVSNALGQFCLNVDIIQKMLDVIEGKIKNINSLNEYLMSVDGHPQKRLRKVMDELGERNTEKRKDKCIQMFERLKICWKKISSNFPKLINDRHFTYAPNKEQWMLINDEINQAFLHFFVDISGLSISCYHSKDAGVQLDALTDIFERKTGILIVRNDMSCDIQKRAGFYPKIKDISGKGNLKLY